jgi:hypothetical protein
MFALVCVAFAAHDYLTALPSEPNTLSPSLPRLWLTQAIINDILTRSLMAVPGSYICRNQVGFARRIWEEMQGQRALVIGSVGRVCMSSLTYLTPTSRASALDILITIMTYRH